ncbi:MAG: hypothetical protein ACE37F_20480 [Nannocystaceae bacterium]|nr:hypothetical protein [bacterium]
MIGVAGALMLLAADVGLVPAPQRPNVVGIAAGVDGSTMTLSLLAGRSLRRLSKRRAFVSGSFDLPMAQPDFGDWRLRAGFRMEVARWKGLALPVRLDGTVRMLTNRSVRALGLGTELTVAPGWYARRWFAGAELAWDQGWGAHLRHSDAYRRVVYQDVQDGWVRLPGRTLRYGARVGGLPVSWLEIWLRAGYEQHGRFDQIAPPLYAIVGTSVRF